MKRLPLVLVVACLTLALEACGRSPSLTAQEKSSVNVLTANMKTRCVGRYLIDVPADSVVFGTARVNQITVESKPMSLAHFKDAMNARSAELNAIKSHKGYRVVFADRRIDSIPESRYFLSLGSAVALTDAERLVEAYRWDRGYQIKMSIEATDAKKSSYFKDDPDGRDSPEMNTVLQKSQSVISLLSQARGRPDDEIPTEPGACFQGGFIPGKQLDSERIEAHFALPANRDVSFYLETNTAIHETTTLLQRSDDINAVIKQDPIAKAIRKGDVALQGMKAEEWLLAGATDLRVPGFLFSLEANSLVNRDRLPIVMLDMRAGSRSALTDDSPKIEKASLDERGAIELWDAVSRTLRPRPNAF